MLLFMQTYGSIVLRDWGSGLVLYVERVLGAILSCGWVHKRCSGVKGSLVGFKDMFVEESLDLGNGAHLENVGKFCYMGDILIGGGGVNSASMAMGALHVEDV